MSTPAANTFPPEAGSVETGIAEAERFTATVNSEEVVETGLFTATVTAQEPPKFIWPNFDRMPPELKTFKSR
jgi:hypothetical protein